MNKDVLLIFLACSLWFLISCGDSKPSSLQEGSKTSSPEFDLSEAKPPPTNVYAKKKEDQAVALSEKEDNKISEEPAKKVVRESKPKKKPKPKQKRKRPKITYDSLVYHLPDVIEGEVIHHDIHFTNTGDAPLSISYVKPSCGCTQPSFPFLDIEPGESGIIGVDYHSVGKSGEQQAELTVTSNTVPETSVITLEVNVLPRPDQE